MSKKQQRPYIGILFKCCGVYSRIHLNKARTAYVGWCPRCCRKVEAKVSPTGTKQRFFSAH